MNKLSEDKFNLIEKSCDDILNGKNFDEHFPLVVWQTGSGTQTNMNVNEVLASRANEYVHLKIGMMTPIHPNDHINMCQSSNDIFPTAMNVCVVFEYMDKFAQSMKMFRESLSYLSDKFSDVIKIGRTHMQDAVPMTLGQEFGGYASQIEINIDSIEHAIKGVCELAIGGTAVGTGLNAPKNFDVNMCHELNNLLSNKLSEYKLQFRPAENKFAALASHDRLCCFSNCLSSFATALFKIASDIRLLSSGPRCGLAEIVLPANEPGSSIMPGKINPTQCESMTMVCIQVIANCHAVTLASSQGHLELNVFKPLIISNILHSMELLSDSVVCFKTHCLDGINVNYKKINSYLESSCMIVTALNPIIGYEKAAKISKYAMENDVSIREAVVQTGLIDMDVFDKVANLKAFI